MSSALPPKPRVFSSRRRVTIVASRYNEEFTDALVENCLAELEDLMPQVKVELVRVPGAFEVPVAVEGILTKDQKPNVIIALGLIIRGATAHGDLVAASVTDALQQSAIRHMVPVIHEVLLVDDEKQAYARTIASKLNRGREAARAAAGMADLFTQLKL